MARVDRPVSQAQDHSKRRPAGSLQQDQVSTSVVAIDTFERGNFRGTVFDHCSLCNRSTEVHHDPVVAGDEVVEEPQPARTAKAIRPVLAHDWYVELEERSRSVEDVAFVTLCIDPDEPDPAHVHGHLVQKVVESSGPDCNGRTPWTALRVIEILGWRTELVVARIGLRQL